MRLVRFGPAGRERPGLLDAEGVIRDLSRLLPDIGPQVLADGALERVRAADPLSLPTVRGNPRLGAPLARVGKIVCVGLNYRAHAEEASMEVPTEPVLFMKSPGAITGPTDPVLLPRGSSMVDWEVELGVVIGRRASYVPAERALDHVVAYCLANDLSERGFQLARGGQWVKGKSCDSFAPLGPWLLTADEVSDPQDLDIWLDVNGTSMQSSNTRLMIFPVSTLISYISAFMTLEPGDLLLTGTPPGVGMGQTPPRYLRENDRLRFGISGLGEQEHVVTQCGSANQPAAT